MSGEKDECGVLLSGYLDKPHGAFGSWTKRFYVLTDDALSRFKRRKDDVYFGEEIAHFHLSTISRVAADGCLVHFEVERKPGRFEKRTVRAKSPSSAEKWGAAVKAAVEEMVNRKSGGGKIKLPKELTPGGGGEGGGGGGGGAAGGRDAAGAEFLVRVDGGGSGNVLVADQELCLGRVHVSSVLVVEEGAGGAFARLAVDDAASMMVDGEVTVDRTAQLEGGGESKQQGARAISVRVRLSALEAPAGGEAGKVPAASQSSGSAPVVLVISSCVVLLAASRLCMAKETVAALSLPGTLLAWALVVAWVLSQTLMMLGLYWKKAPAPAK
jgi:hypothetical protein